MHLRWDANSVREAITQEIDGWKGDVAVVTGDLEDELGLARYRDLNRALARASFRTRGAPDNYCLPRAARRIVTGAWADNDGSGCVTCVEQALCAAGYDSHVSETAPASDDERE
jgi:hypothetical protein